MSGPYRRKGETAGESPLHLAKRLALGPTHGAGSFEAVTYQMILDWAVLAYWRKRIQRDREAA